MNALELRRGGGASSNTRDGQTALAAHKAADAERAEEATRAKAAEEEAKRREAADAEKVAKQETRSERRRHPRSSCSMSTMSVSGRKSAQRSSGRRT